MFEEESGENASHLSQPIQKEGYTLFSPEYFAERFLSPRRRDVLKLMAKGLNNTQIAAKIRISPKTVDTHVYWINRELKTQSRLEAVLKGLEMKIINAQEALGSIDLEIMRKLTPAEKDILRSMTQVSGEMGKNKEIAQERETSRRTTESQLYKLRKKTKANSRIQLALMYLAAKKQGIV